ncbi:uncharacterized protein F5147DRAFT_580795 [Suillus discolor]|uniref:Uncharacterized protein n=1 Tax=Suillus discolor TaxID=1912936 RepID=A0A9P7JRD1_9AGAM|nr:uncharacterized protein F5147DRAFT_580795 [Suillus discolor]KAG2102866.1 hypothetical protein F5147DRAFT_580795 [Suillus discolor]
MSEYIENGASGLRTSFHASLDAGNRAARAIKFAFPHREDELAAYGEYINDKFDRRLQRTHERLIRCDKAVRNRAANSR